MNSKVFSVGKIIAVAVIAAVFLLLTFILASYRYTPTGDVIERSPSEMSERVNELLRSLGYRDRPGERWSEYKYEKAGDDKQVVRFVERQSLDYFNVVANGSRIEPVAELAPGERRVVLDSKGRLVELAVRFPKTYDSSEPAGKFDWNVAFTAAGLDLAAFTPIDAAWTPRAAADTYAAWNGKLPDDPNVVLRVEASTFRGQLTNFLIVYPWNEPEQSRSAPTTSKDRLLISLSLVALAAFGFIFIRRVWTRTAEPATEVRPAFLLALATFVPVLIGQLATTPQVPAFGPLLERLTLATMIALAAAAAVWSIYLATASFVSRKDVNLLSSWQIVSSGKWFSRIIGNDVLVGVLAGTSIAVVTGVRPSNAVGINGVSGTLSGLVLSPFGTTLLDIGWAFLAATVVFGMFALLVGIVRHRLIAGALLFLMLCALSWYCYGGNDISLVLAIAISFVTSFVVARFGLLTTVVAFVVSVVSVNALLALVATTMPSIAITLASSLIVALLFVGVLFSLKGSTDRDQRTAV